MAGTKDVYFSCPHCRLLHKRAIDTGIFYAEIIFRCDAEAGGCAQKMLLKCFLTGEIQVSPLSEGNQQGVGKIRVEEAF